MKGKVFRIVRGKDAWEDSYFIIHDKEKIVFDDSGYPIKNIHSCIIDSKYNNITNVKLKPGEQKKFRLVEVKK